MHQGQRPGLQSLGILSAVLLFAVSCLAQSPSIDQSPSSAGFQFTQVDLNLLAEVNELDKQLTKKGLVLMEPGVTAYVQSVGERLLGNQPPPERVEFKFRVLRDPTINAFALPNGSIYVNSGLVALLDNEAELASVLGHEITHVTNRHTYIFNRSIRKKMVMVDIFQAAQAGSGFFRSGSVAGAVLSLSGTLGQVLTVTTIFGYSRDLEREADRYGQQRMYHAGYDPHAMPRTFELLDERLEFEPVVGLYRDHPKLKERQETTQDMAEKLGGRDQLVGTEADYLSNTASAICYNIRADLESRRARTALARARKLTQWQPQESSYLVLEADSYRVLGAKTALPSSDELEKHGQAEHRKRYFKLTEEEEQRELLAKPGGQEQRQANFEKAQKYYLSAIQADERFSDPHRGLGFLYQQEGRTAEAIEQYQLYLKLAPPDAFDRLRIERRLTSLQPGTTPNAILPVNTAH